MRWWLCKLYSLQKKEWMNHTQERVFYERKGRRRRRTEGKEESHLDERWTLKRMKQEVNFFLFPSESIFHLSFSTFFYLSLVSIHIYEYQWWWRRWWWSPSMNFLFLLLMSFSVCITCFAFLLRESFSCIRDLSSCCFFFGIVFVVCSLLCLSSSSHKHWTREEETKKWADEKSRKEVKERKMLMRKYPWCMRL